MELPNNVNLYINLKKIPLMAGFHIFLSEIIKRYNSLDIFQYILFCIFPSLSSYPFFMYLSLFVRDHLYG